MIQSRKTMLDRLIEINKLGAVVFWRPDELVMLLGYLPCWGLSFLVVTLNGTPVLYVPEAEPQDILPKDIVVETYPWGILDCADPWQVLFEKIKQQLIKDAVQHKAVSFIRHIGGSAPCRMCGEQPPLPASLICCLEKISNGGYADITQQLLKLYDYKTKEDIAGLKIAHRVAAKAVEKFYECMRPGITEKEVAAEVEAAVQQTTGTTGVEFARAWAMIQSGQNTCDAGRYNRTSGKEIKLGELVLMEIGICVNGYWADITRTISSGNPTFLHEKLFDTVAMAQEKAIGVMRPGVPMAEVDFAARQNIAAAGWAHLYNHALGHQVGFRYHDPGPVLSPHSMAVLEEGMVLTVEPGIYGKEVGGGVRIEDNVLITANGIELLSAYGKYTR